MGISAQKKKSTAFTFLHEGVLKKLQCRKYKTWSVCRLCNKNCNVYKIAKDFPHELYLIELNSDSLKCATEKDWMNLESLVLAVF